MKKKTLKLATLAVLTLLLTLGFMPKSLQAATLPMQKVSDISKRNESMATETVTNKANTLGTFTVKVPTYIHMYDNGSVEVHICDNSTGDSVSQYKYKGSSSSGWDQYYLLPAGTYKVVQDAVDADEVDLVGTSYKYSLSYVPMKQASSSNYSAEKAKKIETGKTIKDSTGVTVTWDYSKRNHKYYKFTLSKASKVWITANKVDQSIQPKGSITVGLYNKAEIGPLRNYILQKSTSSTLKSDYVTLDAGTYYICVKGKNSISINDTGYGITEYTLKVNAISTPKVKATSTSKKKVSLALTNLTKNSTVEIQYSTDKKFKKNVTKITKSVSSTKLNKNIGKLKSGKTYYVRVRTIKKYDGKTVKSAWSSKAKIKVK